MPETEEILLARLCDHQARIAKVLDLMHKVLTLISERLTRLEANQPNPADVA